jgi:ribosomal protein S21
MVKVVLQGDLENLYRRDEISAVKAMLNILRKACSAHMMECKRHERFESPGEKRRRKKQESIRERKKNEAKAKRELGG